LLQRLSCLCVWDWFDVCHHSLDCNPLLVVRFSLWISSSFLINWDVFLGVWIPGQFIILEQFSLVYMS
jgi:hypothetical protein